MFQRMYLLILCIFNTHHRERCLLNTRIHFGEPLPVIIRNGRLLEPDDHNGNVIMENGDAMTLSCEGTGAIIHPNVVHQLTVARVSCESGDYFKNNTWLNSPGRFSLFRCFSAPVHSSRRTNRTCYDRFPIIEVGYTVDNGFYPAYETCFDDLTFNAIYSKYTQKPYNAMYQTKVERPFFLDNNNYINIPVDSLFSQYGQRAAMAQLLGPMVETYIKNDVLSRGHLAAKTDFVFAFSERSTFHYVNCAPQWRGFNGGNWNTLEVDLRNHIHNALYDTVVYTGTFGISQLANQFGNRVDLHLYKDVNNNPVIPIPLYFYKVVYEPTSKRGIAYIGINNPYYTEREANELFFCEDVCRNDSRFSWLTWHPNNPAEGYTFCCTIPDFANTVRHLPYFQVTSLLI